MDARITSDDPLVRALRPDAPEVADAFERLRRAEARLERRREEAAMPSDVERAVLRRVVEAAESGAILTPSALAAQLQLGRPAMSQILRRLEARGLLRRSAHPDDGRRRTIELGSAEPTLGGDDALMERYRAVTARLTDHDRRWLVDLLDELRSILDDSVPTGTPPAS